MTAPRLKGHAATCAGKRRHPDELTARAAAVRVLNHPKAATSILYVYPCPVCRGWHLTKRERGNGTPVTPDNPFDTSVTDARLVGFGDVEAA